MRPAHQMPAPNYDTDAKAFVGDDPERDATAAKLHEITDKVDTGRLGLLDGRSVLCLGLAGAGP